MKKINKIDKNDQNPISFSLNPNVAKYFKSYDKALILKELKFWNESKISTKAFKHKLPLVFYSARYLVEKFEAISKPTATRILSSLVSDGILFRCIANKMQRDVTFSYLVNIEKYNIISSGGTYSDANNELFKVLCNKAVNENDFNDNSNLDIELSRFLNNQNEFSKPQKVGNIVLNNQNDSLNNQNESTLPSITSSNKKELINSEISDKELKTIKLMIDIFKNYFSEVRINKNSYNLLLKIYNQVGSDLRTYKQSKKQSGNIMQKDVLEVLVSILIVLNKRITDKKKRNLGYLKTAIQNEAIENHIKVSNSDLLKHLSERGIKQHNKLAKEKGEAYAIATAKRYLVNKGIIKQETNN
jgi:hypothetical protein